MSEQPQRPTIDDRAAWRAHWQAQGMPWRTESEIDEERQRFLAERRAVRPDVERGIYPFRNENGGIRLTRADVEWLLATHESGGMRGPVDWRDEAQRSREGLDLRGADLTDAGLDGLSLARLRGGLTPDEQTTARPEQMKRAAIRLVDASLRGAHLEGALLGASLLERADCTEAHLEDCTLELAYLTWCNLGGAHLERANLITSTLLCARLPAAHLEGANLRGAQLGHAAMDRAHLEGAHLSWAHLQGAFLRGAWLADATFNDFAGVRAREKGWPLASSLGSEAHLEGATLDQVHAERADLRRAHLEGASLVLAHLEGAILREVRLTGANLSGANLEGADLRRAWCHGANFSDALGVRAQPAEAHLEMANLSDAHLEGAFLCGVHLAGATLDGAHLERADLRGARLDAKQMPLEDVQRIRRWLSDFPDQVPAAHLEPAHLDATTALPSATRPPAPPPRHIQGRL
jgi:uncharacterized protein YjbI with pentapeptide repeats